MISAAVRLPEPQRAKLNRNIEVGDEAAHGADPHTVEEAAQLLAEDETMSVEAGAYD